MIWRGKKLESHTRTASHSYQDISRHEVLVVEADQGWGFRGPLFTSIPPIRSQHSRQLSCSGYSNKNDHNPCHSDVVLSLIDAVNVPIASRSIAAWLTIVPLEFKKSATYTMINCSNVVCHQDLLFHQTSAWWCDSTCSSETYCPAPLDAKRKPQSRSGLDLFRLST